MCGVIGYTGNKNAVPFLVEGLTKLEYRGYDSAGITTINDNKINICKAKGRIDNLKTKIKETNIKGNVGIGHTRWATHGAPSDVNSHPHLSNDGSISIIHNGIIENYSVLKDELIKNGYKFYSETDSEVVPNLIEFFYKQSNDIFDAIYKLTEKIEGAYAIGVLCKDYPDQIIALRKDSPLVIGIGDGENFIASDMPAILKYTKKTYLLEDGEVAIITPSNINIFDKNKNQVKKEIFKVEWDIEAAEKDGFDYFMIKEIFEQDSVVKKNIEHRLKNNDFENLLDNINLSKDDFKKFDKIHIVACGTAYYSGLIGKFLIEKMLRIPVFSEVASEFKYKDPIVDSKTLVIVISQSGETADTLSAMRFAKQKGAKILAIVNVVGSTISREADDVLYTFAGPEVAVASTKAFTAQLVAIYFFTLKLALDLGKISKNEFEKFIQDIKQIPILIKQVLERSNEIEKLAKKYANAKNVFYIGRGLDYIISLEGSLKLKEIAYVHSESYQAGELKHGSIALIEEGTLVFGILTQDDLFEKTFSNLKEVKARGADVLAITTKENDELLKEFDHVFCISKTNWMFDPLVANIVQQLFAYYVAVELGNDVDKPRNLAKSVTVE